MTGWPSRDHFAYQNGPVARWRMKGRPRAVIAIRRDLVGDERRCRPGRGDGYTLGMKTAVSIPDDLFRRADEYATRSGKSRSELYREALADYLARRDPQAVTAALNAIADELSRDRAGFNDEATRRALERSEW